MAELIQLLGQILQSTNFEITDKYYIPTLETL